MDKDRLKGKAKDVTGRIERQAGEWAGDEKTQAKGAAKQAEGKVQNIAGRAKDAGRDALRNMHKSDVEENEEQRPRKKDVA